MSVNTLAIAYTRSRQPEEQREHRCLDAERNEEHHREPGHQDRLTGCPEFDGDVGHVQRTGRAIEESNRSQE
jgi:hypothetical protein